MGIVDETLSSSTVVGGGSVVVVHVGFSAGLRLLVVAVEPKPGIGDVMSSVVGDDCVAPSLIAVVGAASTIIWLLRRKLRESTLNRTANALKFCPTAMMVMSPALSHQPS